MINAPPTNTNGLVAGWRQQLASSLPAMVPCWAATTASEKLGCVVWAAGNNAIIIKDKWIMSCDDGRRKIGLLLLLLLLSIRVARYQIDVLGKRFFAYPL
jgi:hypothetical protein